MFAAKSFRSFGPALLAAVAGFVLALPARADTARVALLNLVDGRAAVQLAGSDEWVGDLANRPLASGDRVWVEEGSRAELHIGSTALRLGERTALRLESIGDDLVRLRLTAGSLSLRVRSLDDDDSIIVETPAGELEVLAPGGYRIDADDGVDAAHFTVWSGRARVRGPQLLQTLRSDERIDVAADDDYARVARAERPDRLDLWAEQRDAREDDARAARYVPREMVGYADLDAWGDWQDDAVYGVLWYPRGLAIDWAPFRFGYWSYIGPWGWTWIDDAPWGFAPCHYGRWIRASHGWAWAPGVPREVRRPSFTPAAVTWLGLRPGRNEDPRVGGRIGWAPLGHGGDPRVATAVDRDTFTHARPVAPRRVGLNEREWRRAQPVEAPRVAPGGGSLGRAVDASRPMALPDRSVFERRNPVAGRAPVEGGARPGGPNTQSLPAQRNQPAQRDQPVQRDTGVARDPVRVPRDPPAREDRAQQVPTWQQDRPQRQAMPQAPIQQLPAQRDLPVQREVPVQQPVQREMPVQPMRPIERPAPEARRFESPAVAPAPASAWRPAPQAAPVVPAPQPQAQRAPPAPAQPAPAPQARVRHEEDRDHR